MTDLTNLTRLQKALMDELEHTREELKREIVLSARNGDWKSCFQHRWKLLLFRWHLCCLFILGARYCLGSSAPSVGFRFARRAAAIANLI